MIDELTPERKVLPRVSIVRQLQRWRRERIRSIAIEGLPLLLAVPGAVFVFFAVLDSIFPMPQWSRWCALISLIGAAGGSSYFLVVRPILRLKASDVFREVSLRFPELAPFLLSAWEFTQWEPPDTTSSSLANAHIEQAELLLSKASGERIFAARFTRTERKAWAALSAAGALSGLWLWHASPGLGRILAPWSEIPLEARVEVEPGDARVSWASAVTVRAKLKIKSPGEGGLRLWLRSADGRRASWTQVPWDSEQRGAFSYRIDDVTHRLEYQLRWRDQSTRAYLIEPVPFPELLAAKARVHLPGASGAAGEASEVNLEGAGELSALQGSWVVIHGKPSVPLSHAALRISYLGGPVEMKRAPSGEYEAGFPLNQEGSFQFELRSEEGVEDPHPVVYKLKMLADEPPTIELLSPAFEVESSPRDPLSITYEAHDDYGLTSIDLIYRLRGQERIVNIKRFDRASADQLGDYAWDLSGMPMGEKIEFQLRAYDNHAPTPQSALSKKSAVRLVDFETAHANMEKQWLSAEKSLEALAEKESEARRASEELARASSPQQKQDFQNRLNAADKDLPSQWAQAEAALQQLSDSMEKDPYANPGMQQQTKSIAENLKSTREAELPKAMNAAKQGRSQEAASRHRTLEEEAKKAKRLLSEGKEVQGLQDFWSQAERMDQSGADLTSALSEMAKHPKAISEHDRKALSDALAKLDEAMDALKTALDAAKPPPGSPADARRKTFVVPLNAAKQAADALQKALDAGDYAAAAKMAQQLSEELSRVRQALADAARAAASGGSGGPEQPMPSDKMEAAMKKWQDALDAQSKSLSTAQKLEEERLKSKLEAQKKLLDKLAARQQAVIDRSERLGGVVPVDALTSMSAVLNEFKSKEVSKSPQLLSQIVQRLGVQAATLPNSLQYQAPELGAVSKEEKSILDDLNKGVEQPDPSDSEMSDAQAASALQTRARQKTADLGRDLQSIRSEVSTLPQKVMDSVDGAESEQSSALGDLKGLNAPSAVKHESKALEMLDQGLKDMSSATEQQRKMEQGMGGPFGPQSGGKPGGMRVRQNSGADTGFVPLPSSKDYQPPEEIRRNLEQSLQEKRPRSYDDVIKDYFKRISQ